MASPVLTARSLGDLIATTLPDLGEMKFTEITTDLQDHLAMRNLLRKNRVELGSGTYVQWDVMVNQSGAASNNGIGGSDNVSIIDTMVQASADWRNSTTNYALIGQEVSMNQGARQIVKLVQVRRLAAMISLAELMEANFWGPSVDSTDNLTPWGVKTWLQRSATEGFNGGLPSGYTTIGLSTTSYPRWKNWTAQYTNPTREDLVRKLRKASQFTKFMPPVDGIPTFNTGDSYGYYTNYSVIAPMEEILEGNNDNLGPDIASQDGKVLFRRTPLTWVPKLEADTTGPVIGINWGEFKTYVLRGWWLKETAVPIVPGQHTISAQFVDCTYQWITKNRRRHFIIATSTTDPS